MKVLHKISTRKNNVLCIHYTGGGIEKDKRLISRVQEATLFNTTARFAFKPLKTELFGNQTNTYSEPLPSEGFKSKSTSFKPYTWIKGDRLVVKHYMKGPELLQLSSQPEKKVTISLGLSCGYARNSHSCGLGSRPVALSGKAFGTTPARRRAP